MNTDLKIALSAFSSMITVFLVGAFMNALHFVLIVLFIMCVINRVLHNREKRMHARPIKSLGKYFMCYIVTSSMVLLCVVCMKHTQETLPMWKTILFGFILIAFCTIGVSKLFYADGETPPQKHKLKIKADIQLLTKDEARTYLTDLLPHREAIAIFYTDWHGYTREHVGSFYLDGISAGAVRDLKSSGYKKLVYKKFGVVE